MNVSGKTNARNVAQRPVGQPCRRSGCARLCRRTRSAAPALCLRATPPGRNTARATRCQRRQGKPVQAPPRQHRHADQPQRQPADPLAAASRGRPDQHQGQPGQGDLPHRAQHARVGTFGTGSRTMRHGGTPWQEGSQQARRIAAAHLTGCDLDAGADRGACWSASQACTSAADLPRRRLATRTQAAQDRRHAAERAGRAASA